MMWDGIEICTVLGSGPQVTPFEYIDEIILI